MRKNPVLLVLSILLIISIGLNIWSLVPAFSGGSSEDNNSSQPAKSNIYALFVGNPPVNEAAPDSIYIIHQYLKSTEQIKLEDSHQGYAVGHDSQGFEVFYGAHFGSPNYILYTIYSSQQPPLNGLCPLNVKKSNQDAYYFDSGY
jgi:hypothetical protein